MTIAPIAKGLDREGFTAYVAGDVAANMKLWRPRGVVLHNTDLPRLSRFYLDGKDRPLSGEQRVKNMWVTYQNAKWAGGPHLVVTDREILLGNPLWLAGTHSPSWNSTFWGLEMAGNFDVEEFPASMRDNAVHACATLYAALGHEPNEDTFKFHKEDTRTTHKNCPGKNVGSKKQWIAMIAAKMAELNPGTCQCSCKDHVA